MRCASEIGVSLQLNNSELRFRNWSFTNKSSEVDPDIKYSDCYYSYHKKLLNSNQKIKKITENDGDVLGAEKEADYGKSMQWVDKTGNNKNINAIKIYLFIRDEKQTAGDYKYPDKKVRSFPGSYSSILGKENSSFTENVSSH